MLLFSATGGWGFWFRDYFWLVARCIVHTCARWSYTMSWAHIIGPQSHKWSGWHSSCLAVWACGLWVRSSGFVAYFQCYHPYNSASPDKIPDLFWTIFCCSCLTKFLLGTGKSNHTVDIVLLPSNSFSQTPQYHIFFYQMAVLLRI